METEPQITFHQLPHSDALETTIRAEIADLERIQERIVSCRVVVTAPSGQQQHRLFEVRIELAIPGEAIAVTRPHHHTSSHEDPYVAVRDAFRVARRQLESHAQRRATLKTRPDLGPG
jgi:ribosome-associated translation inhibitor RaiA